jgi:hypothetical protein
VKFWTRAFATDATLALDRQNYFRESAAFDAALAGSGRGTDNPPLDDVAKASLRNQALEWLKAEIEDWSHFLEKAPCHDRPIGFDAIYRWQSCFELAGVRNREFLAKLPESERNEWRAFWAGVDRVRNERKIKW